MSVFFCGVGGQGVLTAAEVCGWAAILDGFHVKKSEVHGMAQRGGSVESHLRFGEKVFSPLIPEGQADILVPFNKEEEQRHINMLRSGGVDLINELDRAMAIPDKKFVNTFMLGALSSRLDIKEESWHEAIKIVYKGRKLEENIKYFDAGRGAK